MGAPNFHTVNTSCYYVVDLDDSENYYDLIGNIQNDLINQGNYLFVEDGKIQYPSKDYPEIIIGTLYNDIVEYVIFLRFGYYNSACLDYEKVEKIIPEDLKDKIMEDEENKLIEYIEKNIFDKYAEKYKRTALFSNGEAIYEKLEE
jgi:hypothetical protein